MVGNPPRKALVVAPTILEGAFTLVALALVLHLPRTSIDGLWLVGGVGLVKASRLLPTRLRRATNIGGLLLAAAAVFGSVAGEIAGLLPPTGVPTLAQSAQLTLTGATLLYLWETYRQREQALVFPTLALVYMLVCWLTLDYLPDPLIPVVALGVGIATLLVAPFAPGQSPRLLEWVGYAVVFLAAYAGIAAGRYDSEVRWLALSSTIWAQATLVMGAVVLAVRGIAQERRGLLAVAGAMVYLCYAWVAVEQDVTRLQFYSVPLAVLLLSYGWLFPPQRRVWEIASVFTLLSVAGLQTLGDEALFYSLVLGGWGILLLVLGITLNRRVLLVGGIVGLIFAALHQLWSVVATLPPAAIIALVGLGLMVVAVLLTLTRDRWMKRLQRP